MKTIKNQSWPDSSDYESPLWNLKNLEPKRSHEIIGVISFEEAQSRLETIIRFSNPFL